MAVASMERNYYRLSAIFFGSFISIYLFFSPLLSISHQPNPFRHRPFYERVCPESGPDSAAPLNQASLSMEISKAVARITERDRNAVVVSTAINKEAAKENLPHFLRSLTLVTPPMIQNAIVFCLDKWSCDKCAILHTDPSLCLFMNLGVSEGSLAPQLGSRDFKARSYWRLTYGRVFATLKIHSEGVSVLPVDVDAVMLLNPFASSEEIPEKPDSIAALIDTVPFEFSSPNTGLLLNGGFLYFPATNPRSAILTNEVIRDIWKESCTAQNEQLVTTTVLKELYNKTIGTTMDQPRILDYMKYKSFCSTKCGTSKFRRITSIEDLHNLEKEMEGAPDFKECTKEHRKKWVFFHAACTAWPDMKSDDLAKAKGAVQVAIMEWVKEARNNGH